MIASIAGRCRGVAGEQFGELLTACNFQHFRILFAHSPNFPSRSPNRSSFSWPDKNTKGCDLGGETRYVGSVGHHEKVSLLAMHAIVISRFHRTRTYQNCLSYPGFLDGRQSGVFSGAQIASRKRLEVQRTRMVSDS